MDATQFDLARRHYLEGRLNDAETLCRAIVQSNPDAAEAWQLLSLMWWQSGKPREALDAGQRAVVLRPTDAGLMTQLADFHHMLGHFSLAIDLYYRAVHIDPNNADALGNLGAAYIQTGKWREAEKACRDALILNPKLAEPHANLGYILYRNGDFDGAEEACQAGIRLRGDLAVAHNTLGNILRDVGRTDESIASFDRALAIGADNVQARSNKIFTMHYQSSAGIPEICRETSEWNRLHAAPLAGAIQAHSNDRNPDRVLRIGYVSADFCEHACACFLDPLLRSHNHEQFRIYIYSNTRTRDLITAKFELYADQWISTTGMSDDQLAGQIRGDGIDILIDAKLHTAGNRLLVFARKPAPVQISWLGFPGSSGLATMDYRLSDRHIEPAQIRYPLAEQPIDLPDCFWCYDPLSKEPPVNPLPASANHFLTFGSLSTFAKATPHSVQLWGLALKAVPGSRLLLLAPKGSARDRVRNSLVADGIDASRVEFADRCSRPEFLALHHRFDVVLDSLPYNGHTTSLDAMWMGVPAITRVGCTPPGRVGLSHCANLGLVKFAAQSDEQFARIAREIAADLPMLARLRTTLRARLEQSPLMDAKRYARNVEAAYRSVWKKWCESGQ